MTEQFDADVAVIGAGILGLSTAMALSRAHEGLRVVALEQEAAIGQHQSGNNSGVIHSGLYYRPGSDKARMAVEGAERMYAFCAEHGHRRGALRQGGRRHRRTRTRPSGRSAAARRSERPRRPPDDRPRRTARDRASLRGDPRTARAQHRDRRLSRRLPRLPLAAGAVGRRGPAALARRNRFVSTQTA